MFILFVDYYACALELAIDVNVDAMVGKVYCNTYRCLSWLVRLVKALVFYYACALELCAMDVNVDAMVGKDYCNTYRSLSWLVRLVKAVCCLLCMRSWALWTLLVIVHDVALGYVRYPKLGLVLGMLWLSHAEMRCEGKSCMEMRHALACTSFWCLRDFEPRMN